MAVDIQKLLPQRPVENRTIVILSDTSLIKSEKNPEEKTAKIEEKIRATTKLLAGTIAAEKKQLDDERKEEEEKKREDEEGKLESKGKKKKDKKDLTTKIPGMSFIDRIKKFINGIIFGWLLVRMVDFLPLLLPIVKGLAVGVNFFADVIGKIFNSLVSFVDFGYKAYEWTRGAIKNIGGENAAENFDKLAGALNKFLNVALIVGMATIGTGGKPTKPGAGRPTATTRTSKASKASRVRYASNVEGVGIRGMNFRNNGMTGSKLAGIRRLAGTAGPNNFDIAQNDITKRYAQRYGQKAAMKRFGAEGLEAAGMGLAKGARVMKFLSPVLKRIPFIGGLIDFAINYFILKEPLGKSAFKAIGSTLVGALGAAIGSVIPGPGTLVGAALGGIAGDALADTIYDMIFKKKEPKEVKVEGKAEGGLVKSRTIGGDKKSENFEIKPDVEKKPDEVKLKENGAIGKIGKEFNKVEYFGPILATTTKILTGEKLSPTDYESVGQGFTNLYLDGVKDGDIKGNSGIKKWVTSSMEKEVQQNKDITKKIDSDEEQLQGEKPTTAKGLIEQYLNMKLGIPPKTSKPGSTAGTGTVAGDRDSATGALTDANVQGSELDLFQRLVIAESGGEGGVGMALVARSVLNRAGLIQSGKASTGTFMANDSSITGVIMGRGQYQPISDGSINTPRTDAQMSASLSAIQTAQDVDKLRGMLKSEGYDDDTVTKMLASTGFRTGGAFNDPSQNVNVTQHKNHYFNTAGNEGLMIVGGSIADAQAEVAEDIKPGKDKKLYLHWTAGGYDSTAGGYHTVITGDGKIHRKMDYNKPGNHTEGRNQNSVGLAVAAMAGSEGNYQWPKQMQIDRLAEESAKITKAWGWKPSDISINKVMTHGEAGSGKDGYLPAVSKKPYNYGPTVWGGDGSRWDLDMLSPSDKIGDGGQKLRSMIKAKYAMGGKTKPGPHLAMVGEEGTEFVIDHDSFKAIEQAAPGFLDLLNKAEGQKAADLLMNYTSYNDPTGSETIIMSKTKVREIVSPQSGSTSTRYVPMGAGSGNNETLDYYG